MRPYAVYYILQCWRGRRAVEPSARESMQFIHSLSEDPFRTGDFQDRDEAGPEIQVKLWAIMQ